MFFVFHFLIFSFSVCYRLSNDIEYMTGSRPFFFWVLCWKYISPIAMAVVFFTSVAKTAEEQPTYLVYVGCIQVKFLLFSGIVTFFEQSGFVLKCC